MPVSDYCGSVPETPPEARSSQSSRTARPPQPGSGSFSAARHSRQGEPMDGLNPSGRVLDNITNELFAVNGRLLRLGDAVSARAGLTSAKWRVMRLLLDGPATVAQLARERGLKRQAVQQTVDHLLAEDLLQAEANPRDRRAPLIHLSCKGRQVLDQVLPHLHHWIEGLAKSIPMEDSRRIAHAARPTGRTARFLREVLGAVGQGLRLGDWQFASSRLGPRPWLPYEMEHA